MNDKYKECSKCSIVKELSEFYNCITNKDGKKNICKECCDKKTKEYAEKNKDQLKQKRVENLKQHRDKINESKRKSHHKNKKHNNAKCKEYYANNKNKILRKIKIYTAKRREEDIEYKIAGNLRTRLNRAIKIGQKSGSAVEDLGCSISELKKHFESLFYRHAITNEEMTWDNYGDWHIDHIIPLSFFDLAVRDQIIIACNYLNLRPLWAEENLKKGDNVPESAEEIVDRIKNNLKKNEE